MDFARRAVPFLDRDLPPGVERPLPAEYIKGIMPLIQERVKRLDEVAGLTGFFFVDELDYEPELLTGKGMSKESALRALETSLLRLKKLTSFDNESLETLLRPLAEELGLKTGQLFGTLRVAATGRTAAPPLFQTMAVLGKERCLQRLEVALAKLSSVKGE